MSKSLALLTLLAGAYAQQVGTSTAETHPKLQFSTCTKAGGCSAKTQSIVLDANWRWVHNTGGYTNCYTGNTWNSQYCPDGATCAKNCALDGADYSGTYGITSSGAGVTLKLKQGSNVGSRVYLMDSTDSKYQMFKLKNQEFTFDVDASQLPCGLNGAVYFVNMDADGGLSRFPTNKAGAKYGTGYCDSQCPQDIKFINGKANSDGWKPSSNSANTGTGAMGSCCPEMDIWEANSISTAYTPHPCKVNTQTACTSDTECGSADGARYSGICDRDGCDFNSYRQGNHSFYGPGSSNTLNSQGKITIVTQFITSDNTATGTLSEIRRIYVQNGKVIQNSVSKVPGVSGNSITSAYCKAQKSVFGDTDYFDTVGGLAGMGKAMDNGMVLVLSLWDDYSVNMLWLDSTYPTDKDASTPGVGRGTCSTSSGKPSDVESQSPNAQVTYSNIKLGAFNTTYTLS